MAKTLPDFVRWLDSRFKRLQDKLDHPDPDEGSNRGDWTAIGLSLNGLNDFRPSIDHPLGLAARAFPGR